MTVSPSRWRLFANIGSSYANVALMALITLLVVPLYVRTLGPAQWGIVALCMTLQGLLFSIDVALAPLMLREVARAALQGRQHDAYRRFRRLYVSCAAILFVLAQVLISVVQHLPAASTSRIPDDLALALRIVLLQFAFQFANNAAVGYWYGLEFQRMANLRLAVFILAKHVAALLLVTLFSPTAIAYLVPFATIAACECVLNARKIGHEHAATARPMSTVPLAESWRRLAGFAFATGIGVLTTQVDRLYLSLNVPAAKYGIYFLVSSLMLSMFSLQVPLHRAYLPRMATSEIPGPTVRSMRRASLALLALPCLVLAVFPQTLLRWWLRDATITVEAAGLLRLMLIAVAMMCVYAPSATQLFVQHRYRALALVNSFVLIIQLAVLVCLTPRLGMLAGGWAWLACGLVQLFAAGLFWMESRHSTARLSP
ncbi:MAG: hypothetical protein ABIW82_16445 [Dokdonella sp.]